MVVCSFCQLHCREEKPSTACLVYGWCMQAKHVHCQQYIARYHTKSLYFWLARWMEISMSMCERIT